MIILRILLIPFSLIYAFIIYLRNKFYDIGIFKSESVNIPVISIGNLTAGGTGKTPLTIFTAEYFLDKGHSVGIIARGYKRKSEGLVVVCDGKVINDSVEETGDELAMTANALSEFKNRLFIAASSDRVKAAKYLKDNFNPDIIILDDGFQHRKLKRNLDIVIADAGSILKNKFLNSFTLPSGVLRESKGNYARADLIIQNNKDKEYEQLPFFQNFGKDVITMRYKTEYLIDYKNIILKTGLNSKHAVIFSGLADDLSFTGMITSMNIKISEKIKFKDHHDYSLSDIEFIKSKFKENRIFITTEKDFIKIKQFREFMENYPVYFLKISILADKNAELLFNNYDKLLK